jgi:hypothetical protein
MGNSTRCWEETDSSGRPPTASAPARALGGSALSPTEHLTSGARWREFFELGRARHMETRTRAPIFAPRIFGFAPKSSADTVAVDAVPMAYIVTRNNRFYVVSYGGIDPRTGRERRRRQLAGTSRADAGQSASPYLPHQARHDCWCAEPAAQEVTFGFSTQRSGKASKSRSIWCALICSGRLTMRLVATAEPAGEATGTTWIARRTTTTDERARAPTPIRIRRRVDEALTSLTRTRPHPRTQNARRLNVSGRS